MTKLGQIIQTTPTRVLVRFGRNRERRPDSPPGVSQAGRWQDSEVNSKGL